MFKKDLTRFKNTIGYVMKNNRDKIYNAKTSQELYDIINNLFLENNINTPKSREIVFKLKIARNFNSALIYINNIMLKAQGLGIN